jgi:dimethylargininase
METPAGTRAIVRGVPNSFHRAIQPRSAPEPIDIELAKSQHRVYCQALEDIGLTLIQLEADERYPDCCYVEDTAVVLGDRAIIARMAAPSRAGETGAVEKALSVHKKIHHLESPATLDGGDVLQIGRQIFVGITERTNSPAVDQLQALLAEDDYGITPVHISGVLHLKSACTYLGGMTVLCRPGHFDEAALSLYRKIRVPANEAHAANCLAVNGRVLFPAGAPQTREHIEAAGFPTLEVDISESRKAAGGLTCGSIIL